MNPAKIVFPLGGFSAAFIVLLALFVIAWWPGAALAGDTTKVEIIGFSETGEYVAYDNFGRADLVPRASSTIRFVRVAQNKFVGRSITHLVKPDAQGNIDEGYPNPVKIRAAARKKAAGGFRLWEIILSQTSPALPPSWN